MSTVVRLAATVVVLAGCTPAEIDAWLDWWHVDPDAAETFANRPDIQAELRDDTSPADPVPDTGVYEPWISLADCESEGNWHIDTGNGYFGGLQFSLQSWQAVGGEGYPHHASPSEQVYRAERLLDLQGWNAWPACSAQLGYG